MGDDLIQETFSQISYTRLYDTDSDDEAHNPLLPPHGHYQPDQNTAREPAAQDNNKSVHSRSLTHDTVGKLAHKTTIPAMSD